MGSDLNKYRKKLKNIENIKNEFPCPENNFSDLYELEVFHFEKWSEEFDSHKQRSSSPKVDIVIEFPNSSNPTFLFVIEYKKLPIKNKRNKPHKLVNNEEINSELIEKLVQSYTDRILKKFRSFCSEFQEIWKNIQFINCYFLLSIHEEEYKAFFKAYNPFPVKELSIDQGVHSYKFKSILIQALNFLKEEIKKKITEIKQKINCCNNLDVDDCEELIKRIKIYKND